MSIIEAIVLGLVQGLTEFIPVSSSGHLQLVPFLFGWKQPTVAFDVAVHFGTLVAVVYVFRHEVRGWIRTALHWRDSSELDRKLLRLVVIGTIPASRFVISSSPRGGSLRWLAFVSADSSK